MTKRPSALGAEIGPIRRIHHVGIIVADLDAALACYRDRLGLPFEAILDHPTDGVRLAFLGAGDSKVELLQPTEAGTGVARFLAKRGEGLHHICLEVDDIAHALERAAAAGLDLIDAAPRRGAEGPVAFIHPRGTNGALVELIEAPGGPAWVALGYRIS
ncbi:MAG: methylmalonyl-CoA epimerase [Chloroflexi bacterium]|nr:methylmalonyl-CoA epimerase [Chloroflexota bacterium]